MVKKRPWRVAFYFVKWNDNVLYMQSRIAAIMIFKEWANHACSIKGEHVVEVGGIAKPYMQQLMHSKDIVDLLNGAWDSFVVTRTTINDGVIVKTHTDPQYKAMHNQCNKLRIKGVYFNNTMRKALSAVCHNYDLLELCFRVPAANVFEALIKLIPEGDLKNKELIVKYARNIFYVMRKPYRKTQ